jgi:hypothetical protein
VKGGDLVDESRSLGVTLASPMLGRAVRLVASGGTSLLLRSTRPDRYYTLGGESGLRGYALGEFVGQAQVIGHVEARSRPFALTALRVGGLLFYDTGHAASRFAVLHPHHDAGVGLRVLIPQLNYYVLRFDWAFAFQATRYSAAGWPGRFSAGFRQVF